MCNNSIFHYFKKLDRFEIPISFRHKKENTYTTWIGGLITLIIIILALIFCIIYLIPFANKENYSLYYYTVNLNKTEHINLAESKSAIAFKFDCPNNKNETIQKYGQLKIEDLMKLNVIYSYFINGSKEGAPIGIHDCTSEDFYNDLNLINSLDNEGFNKLICLDDINKEIKYRFQDRYDDFKYFEINVILINKENASLANEFVKDIDCKVELYYVDVKIEVDDFKKPIKPFLNEVFIQLVPDFNSRMNVFFMNSYFESNNDLFFQSKSSQKINNLFSRTEQYFLNRDKEDSFAKIYIRADTKKMIIKRTYQTLTEFFAVTFSFWEDLFIIFTFLLNTYYELALNYSIIKKLFFFKEKENKFFNIQKNSDRIKKLIELTDRFSKKDKLEKSKDIFDDSEDHLFTGEKIPVKEIKDEKTEEEKDNKADNKNKKKKKIRRRQTLNRVVLVPKQFWNLLNIFECKCCCCDKLDEKTILYSKAEDIINTKLDITYYLKIIFSLDIYNKIIWSDKQEIIKFLSLPIISSKIKDKDKYYQCHQNYSDNDFEKFDENVSEFINKQQKSVSDNELLSLSNQKLKEIDN